MKNSYFKDNEFEGSPIQFFLKRYDLHSSRNKSAYFYMLLSQNEVDLYDSPVFDDVVKKHTIDTRVEYSSIMEIPDGDGTTNAYISAYILMDDT